MGDPDRQDRSRRGPGAAAAREIEEETGWRPGPLRPLLRVEPTPGISDSVHHLYRADSATQIGAPKDDFESSRIEWVPLDAVPGLIGRGEITSGTTLAALLYTMTQRLKGFFQPEPITEVAVESASHS